MDGIHFSSSTDTGFQNVDSEQILSFVCYFLKLFPALLPRNQHEKNEYRQHVDCCISSLAQYNPGKEIHIREIGRDNQE